MVRKAGINLVNCGDCGSVILHEVVTITQETKAEDYTIECPFCEFKGEPCDFPDYFYEGMELSQIFNK